MQPQTPSSILCALCGIKFIPTSGSICPTCAIKSLDEARMLTGDSLNFCRYCMRCERPPWMHCERQSQQMIAILLKKVKGLSKVEFQSASFVWTEPHSKRIKLKIVFKRQVNEKMKVECTQVIQFVEKVTQCPDCRKKFTPHDWVAVVQIRQFVPHKKTILNLQQMILKQKISEKVLKSEPVEHGIDVFFSSENDAHRLVDFVKSQFPTSLKESKQLISHNQQNNTSTVKITFSCVVPKICKSDLVKIPVKLTKELGSCSQVLYCRRVSSSLHFIDVVSFKKIQISSIQYFKYEGLIEIFTAKIYGRVFNILDSEDYRPESGNKLATYDLTVMKEDEFKQLFTRSYFTDELDREVIGFDLTQIESLEGVKNLPDYWLSHRAKIPKKKKKNKQSSREHSNKDKSELESQHRKEDNVKQESSGEQQWSDVEGEDQQQQLKYPFKLNADSQTGECTKTLMRHRSRQQ